jgi:hypothetical protein
LKSSRSPEAGAHAETPACRQPGECRAGDRVDGPAESATRTARRFRAVRRPDHATAVGGGRHVVSSLRSRVPSPREFRDAYVRASTFLSPKAERLVFAACFIAEMTDGGLGTQTTRDWRLPWHVRLSKQGPSTTPVRVRPRYHGPKPRRHSTGAEGQSRMPPQLPDAEHTT